MATTVQHKRGDTFLFSATMRETKTGPAIDLTGWTIASQIRDADKVLIDDVTVTVTDAANGAYSLRVDDTTDWPVGTAYWDIEYTDADGIIRSSETYTLQIIADITYQDPAP